MIATVLLSAGLKCSITERQYNIQRKLSVFQMGTPICETKMGRSWIRLPYRIWEVEYSLVFQLFVLLFTISEVYGTFHSFILDYFIACLSVILIDLFIFYIRGRLGLIQGLVYLTKGKIVVFPHLFSNKYDVYNAKDIMYTIYEYTSDNGLLTFRDYYFYLRKDKDKIGKLFQIGKVYQSNANEFMDCCHDEHIKEQMIDIPFLDRVDYSTIIIWGISFLVLFLIMFLRMFIEKLF